MQNLLATLLITPLMLWVTFTPVLIANANQVDETMLLAVYEGQKEASLQGQYTDAIYQDMEDYLVENHNVDRSKIEIDGTESLQTRGSEITVEVTYPRPITNLGSMLSFAPPETKTVKRTVVSEYVPNGES